MSTEQRLWAAKTALYCGGAFTAGSVLFASGVWVCALPEHSHTFVGYLIDTAESAAGLLLLGLGVFCFFQVLLGLWIAWDELVL